MVNRPAWVPGARLSPTPADYCPAGSCCQAGLRSLGNKDFLRRLLANLPVVHQLPCASTCTGNLPIKLLNGPTSVGHSLASFHPLR